MNDENMAEETRYMVTLVPNDFEGNRLSSIQNIAGKDPNFSNHSGCIKIATDSFDFAVCVAQEIFT